MQGHLDNNCEVCHRDRDLWLGLVNAGKDAGLYEPPEELVKRMKDLLSKGEAIPGSLSTKPKLSCVLFGHSAHTLLD
jgi:hypothetical protein